MGLPNINIEFKTTAADAIRRSEKGVVAMILMDSAAGNYEIVDQSDIPGTLSAANKEHIARALIGAANTPKKLIVSVIETTESNYTDALSYLGTRQWDYLVGPPDIDSAGGTEIVTWIKAKRGQDYIYKAVLPKQAADHEGIIDFDADGIKTGSTTYTAAQYASRIAGILAGTPMTISATYQPLSEVEDITRLTREEGDTAVDAGKLILIHDGKKVKLGRAVNSLTTTTGGKGDAFKKIKIVETVDMIQSDIRATVEDSYIGKYANSYDNKCLLVSAIKGYFEQLELEGILDPGKNTVEINVPAQRAYLKSIGEDVDEMTVQQIKEANTGSKVFLAASIKILDAIEDIDLQITI